MLCLTQQLFKQPFFKFFTFFIFLTDEQKSLHSSNNQKSFFSRSRPSHFHPPGVCASFCTSPFGDHLRKCMLQSYPHVDTWLTGVSLLYALKAVSAIPFASLQHAFIFQPWQTGFCHQVLTGLWHHCFGYIWHGPDRFPIKDLETNSRKAKIMTNQNKRSSEKFRNSWETNGRVEGRLSLSNAEQFSLANLFFYLFVFICLFIFLLQRVSEGLKPGKGWTNILQPSLPYYYKSPII